MNDLDASAQIVESLREASQQRLKVQIQGGASKRFLGLAKGDAVLDTRHHRGILQLDLEQRWVRVRAGTPLTELAAVLAEHGRLLAFEPPGFAPGATVGGMVASGLAGPRRPWAGTVAEHLLDGTLIDALGAPQRIGEHGLSSHLVAGSLGRLGVISEVVLRIHAQPQASLSLRFEISQEQALHQLRIWTRYPSPIRGACHTGDALHIRLEGSQASVSRARSLFGGDETRITLWEELREQRLSFFRNPRPLWRLWLPAEAPKPRPGDTELLDWGGSQRWLKTAEPAVTVQRYAQTLGGDAVCFTPDGCAPDLAQATESEALHEARKAVDPQQLFAG